MFTVHTIPILIIVTISDKMFTRSKGKSGEDQDSALSTSRPVLTKRQGKRGSTDGDGGVKEQKKRRDKVTSESEAVEEHQPDHASPSSPPRPSTSEDDESNSEGTEDSSDSDW